MFIIEVRHIKFLFMHVGYQGLRWNFNNVLKQFIIKNRTVTLKKNLASFCLSATFSFSKFVFHPICYKQTFSSGIYLY